MVDFRSAPGHSSTWTDTSPAFSNFEYIDTQFGSDPILRRIFSLARKLGYRGLLTEEILPDDCDLLVTDNADLKKRKPEFEKSRVTRFSFFGSPKQSAPDPFLGYAIFKQDIFADGIRPHVFEAVLSAPRRQDQNNFVHCEREYLIHNSLGSFRVSGSLYAQQNDATYVCAHVALRTMLACLHPDGDVSYAEINRLAGVDHTAPATRVGNGQGLRPDQMERVLTGLGFTPRTDVHEPGQVELPDGVEFQRLLYEFIESGRPALLGFELAPDPSTGNPNHHVIPVLGHTFNEDLWVPEAERHYFAHDRGYFPSESWLSSYVTHDDNFGPYVCLPRHYLGRAQFRVLIGCHEAEVRLPAIDAETIAADFCNFVAQNIPATNTPWFERFRAFARAGLLVLRAQIVDASQYGRHLKQLKDHDGVSLPEDQITAWSGYPNWST